MRNSSGVDLGASAIKHSPSKTNGAAQNKGNFSEKSGMKVTYFQNTFIKQQLRPYTLRFRNKELEVEYEGELVRNNKTFYTFASACIFLLCLCAAIRTSFSDEYVWIIIVMGLNAVFHFLIILLVRNDFTHLRYLIFCSNTTNILVYSFFLASVGSSFSSGQLVFLQDIYFSVVIIFMRTHVFVLDTSTVVVSRFILAVVLLV